MSSILRRIFIVAALVAVAPSAMGQFGSGPELTAEVLRASEAFRPGDDARFIFRLTIPDGWHINAHEPLEDFLIPTELAVEGHDAIAFVGAVYPEPEEFSFAGLEDRMVVYSHTVDIGFVLKLPDTLEPGGYVLPATLSYQACNETQCWQPETLIAEVAVPVAAGNEAASPLHTEAFEAVDFGALSVGSGASAGESEGTSAPEDSAWRDLAEGFIVTGRNSGYIASDEFIGWLRDVEAGTASTSLNQFAGLPIWLVALLTLVGGLLLNLTPCVLPMIPINLAIIGAGAQAKSKSYGFALGGTYGLAIALVYGVLGLAAAFAGAAFGTLQSSPWFNLAIAVVFAALALAMFDVFAIDFSKYQAKLGGGSGKKGSFGLAFFMGGVAALLAGACVGPVVISVILFSQDLYAQGSPAGLALPFLLGLGMALPWPFAGAAMSFLPKPGAWMKYVKYAFGVLIFAFAAYYGWEGAKLLQERHFIDEEAVIASTEGLDEAGWTHDLAAGLEESRETGKPIFIDFWATWCKNCLTMNQTTFKDAAVTEAMDGYVKVKYQAQQPGQPPAKDVMEHFGVGGLGLPVYVIADPPM